jgi:hypothetical protein
MYRKVTLIVVSNFESFKSTWKVNCIPFLNNGNYLLPLGWEDELLKRGIDFEVKEVELFEEGVPDNIEEEGIS